MKKGIVLLFTVMLLGILAACGRDTIPEAQGDPPVTLTFQSYHAPIGVPVPFVDTMAGQFILDELNIALEVVPTRLDDAVQDMIMDFASGLAADIIVTWTSPDHADILTRAILENQIANLTDTLQQFPNLNSAVQPENLNLLGNQIIHNPEFGGDIFILPTNQSIIAPQQLGWGLYIREDIANALDISMPDFSIRTPDDLHALLTRIQEGGFEDTLGREVYPLGSIAMWGILLRLWGALLPLAAKIDLTL